MYLGHSHWGVNTH